jgi:hypothetical protein
MHEKLVYILGSLLVASPVFGFLSNVAYDVANPSIIINNQSTDGQASLFVNAILMELPTKLDVVTSIEDIKLRNDSLTIEYSAVIIDQRWIDIGFGHHGSLGTFASAIGTSFEQVMCSNDSPATSLINSGVTFKIVYYDKVAMGDSDWLLTATVSSCR